MALSEGITLLTERNDFSPACLVHREIIGRYVTIYCIEAAAIRPSFVFTDSPPTPTPGLGGPPLDDVIINIGNYNFALKMKVEPGNWNIILKDCWIEKSQEIRVSCASNNRYCVYGVCSDRPQVSQ